MVLTGLKAAFQTSENHPKDPNESEDPHSRSKEEECGV